MKIMNLVFFIFVLFSLMGCAAFKEEAKLLWGSSTQALEEARTESLKSTFSCSWDQCFSSVIKYANSETQQLPQNVFADGVTKEPNKTSDQKTTTVKNLDVFIEDRDRKIIVVMGVPGSVNTTEVGIFFSPTPNVGTLVEISSLSSSAKAKAADIIFALLGKEFTVLP